MMDYDSVQQMRHIIYDKYNSSFLDQEGRWDGYLRSMGIGRSCFYGPPYLFMKVHHDSVQIECPWSIQNLPERQILLQIPIDMANKILIMGYLP